jgi:hypothetical protein
MAVDDALDQLAARRPEIEAIGVTDYLTTGSLRLALEAQRDGAAESISLMLPNVELRLDNAVTAPGSGAWNRWERSRRGSWCAHTI